MSNTDSFEAATEEARLVDQEIAKRNSEYFLKAARRQLTEHQAALHDPEEWRCLCR